MPRTDAVLADLRLVAAARLGRVGVKVAVVAAQQRARTGELDPAAVADAAVAHASGREPWREIVQRLTRGKYGRRQGWPVIPDLGTPWQDTISAERPGWRTRSGHICSDSVIHVDYRTCPPCRAGWVENPYTHPRYRRNGLAAITLAQLRREHPGLTWHTLGGHLRDSRTFWAAVGADVPGGYQQRSPCSHVKAG